MARHAKPSGKLSRIPWLTFGLITTVLLYFGVRVLDLDSVVTTDEPFWLGRSANFYRALVVSDLENTYQMAHPGVMTMWAGALAFAIQFPEYAQLAAGNMEVPYGIERHLRNMGEDPLQMMITAKMIKIIFQAVFFSISVVFLSKTIDRSTAFVTAFLIAFSPMTSGFDSALHVDGLFTAISFSAVLVICWASFGRNEAFA